MQALLEFQRQSDASEVASWGFKEIQKRAAAGAGAMELITLMSRPFMPNPLNTVVFVLEVAQRSMAMLVNYRGRPWMKDAGENLAFLLGISGALLSVCLCAVGWEPLRGPLQVVALPLQLQRQLAVLLLLSVLGAIAWDRLVFRFLAPKIYWAAAAEPFRIFNPMPFLRKS